MFFASSIGTDPLGLRDLLQRFADERWLPTNATPDNRAALHDFNCAYCTISKLSN